jgi:hypothetical protein
MFGLDYCSSVLSNAAKISRRKILAMYMAVVNGSRANRIIKPDLSVESLITVRVF